MLIHRYCILESPSAADRSDLLMELYILKEVNKNPHPNVITLIGAFTSEGICDTYLYVMTPAYVQKPSHIHLHYCTLFVLLY